MSAVPVLLTLLGAVMKLVKAAPAMEGLARAGFSERLVAPIGILELICVAVYVIPRTSVLGAILLTGLLGGADRHEAVHWGSLVSDARRSWHVGVGWAVLARCAIARAHPVSQERFGGLREGCPWVASLGLAGQPRRLSLRELNFAAAGASGKWGRRCR